MNLSNHIFSQSRSVWYDKFKSDVFPSGFVVIRGGLKVKPPAYYEKKYDLTDSMSCVNVSTERQLNALRHKEDNTPQRLYVRGEVQRKRLELLTRGLENEASNICGF